MNLAIRPDIPTWKEYMDRTDLWEIQYAMHIEIQSSLIPGTLVYDIRPGYITDFRSGPSIVNPFIPKIGDILLALAWLIHDVNYHGFLSKKYADLLLREISATPSITRSRSVPVLTTTPSTKTKAPSTTTTKRLCGCDG